MEEPPYCFPQWLPHSASPPLCTRASGPSHRGQHLHFSSPWMVTTIRRTRGAACVPVSTWLCAHPTHAEALTQYTVATWWFACLLPGFWMLGCPTPYLHNQCQTGACGLLRSHYESLSWPCLCQPDCSAPPNSFLVCSPPMAAPRSSHFPLPCWG